MSSFQNASSSRKFLFPTKPSKQFPKTESKTQPSAEFKLNGALKIFLESEPNREENSSEWITKNSKRKGYKEICMKKGQTDEKAKKSGKRNRRQGSVQKNGDKKAESFRILESQLVKKKSKLFFKVNQKKEIQSPVKHNDLVKIHEIVGSHKGVKGAETAPPNSLFTLPKELNDIDLKIKTEPIKQPNFVAPPLRAQGSIQKITNQLPPKPTEIKTTSSDYKKIHINEILKGHAQKVQTNPIQSCFSQAKTDANLTPVVKKIEEVKPKPLVKPIKEPEEKQITYIKSTANEEKKKTPDKWMRYPQSNELERRLRGAWQEQGSLFPTNSEQETGNEIEVEKSDDVAEDSATSKEDEKKGEKRTTYTDRILTSKTVGKEDKETEPEKPDTTTKKTESVSRPPDETTGIQVLLTKEVPNIVTNKELMTLRDARLSDGEQIIKTKISRSMEIRDLVTQAIKDHKIFCIFDNHWYIVRPVREELLSRGWLEVIPDRKLIPRRRPPPMGPTHDREKSTTDHTIEAILTAKEAFADEIQESVSKSSSFRATYEKPKLPPQLPSCLTKKYSEDSLNEVLSQFRIVPPTSDKKKSNLEIREFVTKYQSMIEKEKKGKEKNAKNAKKEKAKAVESTAKGTQTEKGGSPTTEVSPILTHLSKSLQAIISCISDNKRVLTHVAAEMKNSNEGADLSGSIDLAENQDRQEKGERTDGGSKALFTDNEAKMISKIIQSTNARIHFMWLSIKPSIHLKCFNYSPEIVNKFQKTTFCTKIGLWNHLNNIQWYAHEVHFPAKSPRMYNTGEADDLQAFFQDFQLTACIGMLKWLSDTFFDRGMKAVQTKKGKVPLKAFEFAIKQCERYIRFKDNEDLGMGDEPKVLQEEWNTFLQWFYIITNDHGKVQESSSAQLMVVYTKAVETLRTMKRHWPEIDVEGRLNIWIMKPYCASCGRGIFMTNNVYYIGQHSKYIVQKYIEKPLLIYNTKFDIRQWFMITKLTPLEIWMYKECYLRFCTQPFALRNLHESVHLSNNSVQRKYVSVRDPGLPDQNMWDSSTFQMYLKTIGHPNIWQDLIYPGMRDAIVSTMLSAQDTFDGPRKSWFEVYGADFMLSSTLKDGPWLIEINENPAMDHSTKITSRLCPQMLRDVIKVVVDKRCNKNASTGEWELVYRQNYSPSFGTVDLDVRGKKIARVPHTMKIGFNSPHLTSTPSGLGRRMGFEDSENSKLYEVVKSFTGDHKNILPFGEKLKTSERVIGITKLNDKDSYDKTPEPANFLKKDKTVVSTPALNIVKEKQMDPKIGKPQEGAKVAQDTKGNSAGKEAKEDKNTFQGKQALRPMQNSSSSVERSKAKKIVGPEPKGSSATSGGKNSRGQKQSQYSAEKFQFTKFYKI